MATRLTLSPLQPSLLGMQGPTKSSSSVVGDPSSAKTRDEAAVVEAKGKQNDESPVGSQQPSETSSLPQRQTQTVTINLRVPGSPQRPPDVWMLADRPLEGQFEQQDRFHFKDYADALVAILDHEKTHTPFTMAINAPWGAGKSTLANMIAAELEQRPKDRGQVPHIICRFNAWMHDGAANLAVPFVAEVTRTANRHRGLIWRALDPLPSSVLEPGARTLRRLGLTLSAVLLTLLASWWIGLHLEHIKAQDTYEAGKTSPYTTSETVLKDAAGTELSRSSTQQEVRSKPAQAAQSAPAADAADPLLKAVQSRILVLGAFLTALGGLAGAFFNFWVSTPLGGFMQSPEKLAEAGAIPAMQRKLKKLIRQATWRGNRFVVFVDDIERCTPPRSIDVLDAMNQLMDHDRVLIVLLGDMSAVAAAAQLKYKELAEIFVPSAGIAQSGPEHGKEAFGRLYLQKIVQFQFDLPTPPRETIRAYMGSLIAPEAAGKGT